MLLIATRPDSVGLGLNNSPSGLAAYIVEKFFVWTGCNVNESSACLDSHFTKDELLTNVMIYWLTNSIASSMRYYKEAILSSDTWNINRMPIECAYRIG
ncbi:hypothetical protein QZH41_009636 [Actinostola sp. cb2023]|nr:hypothetical protein QZH41_009636 [Actinostola sp. cb2023]